MVVEKKARRCAQRLTGIPLPHLAVATPLWISKLFLRTLCYTLCMSLAHKKAARARVASYPSGHMARIRREAWEKKTPAQRKAVGQKLLSARRDVQKKRAKKV